MVARQWSIILVKEIKNSHKILNGDKRFKSEMKVTLQLSWKIIFQLLTDVRGFGLSSQLLDSRLQMKAIYINILDIQLGTIDSL